MSWTLFLYTGRELNNFRANVPDNIVVFANGTYDEARQSFMENVGKEPELMGFEYTEGSSKEEAWQNAINSSLMSDEITFNMAMSLNETLILSKEKQKNN